MQNVYRSHQYSFSGKPVVKKHQGLIADGIYKALNYSFLKYPSN